MISRILSIVLLVTSIYYSNAQNNILRGIVKLQSSSSQPLENVEISAFGSNTVYSNSSGMFQMTFGSKHPGAVVSLLVNKPDYEVINEKEIERCIIRENPDELIVIVMARQGERNRQALSYYNIIIQNSDNLFKKELNALKGQLSNISNNNSERRILLDQITALQQEKENLLNQAEQLARQLASVDLDQASELANRAFEEFNKGNVKAALDILSDETLAESLKTTKAEKERLAERVEKADRAYQQSIDNYIIKARFNISSSDFDGAIEAYTEAFHADTNNIDRILEIAKFYKSINNQAQAINFYGRALKLSNNYKQQIEILLDLSQQQRFNEEFDKSLNNIKKAKEYLLKWNPEYSDINRFTMAEIDMQEVHALILLNRHDEAKDILISVLSNYNDFKHKDEEYRSLIATAQLNLAALYTRVERDFEKASQLIDSCIVIYSDLVSLNEALYSMDLSDAISTLGLNYAMSGNLDEAEKKFLEAISLLKINQHLNYYSYNSRMISLYTNLSSIVSGKRDFDKAIEYQKKALAINKELAKDNPIRYQLSISRSYNNIGFAYYGLNRYDDALENYLAAVKIREELVTINAQRFNYDLCDAYLSTSGVLENVLRRKLDFKYKDTALDLLEKARTTWVNSDTTTRKAKEIKHGIDQFTDTFTTFDEAEMNVQRYINNADSAYAQLNAQQDLQVLQEEFMIIIDSLAFGVQLHPESEQLLDKQSFMYAELAWVLINHDEYSEAEKMVREGMAINPSNNSLKSYLPTALLLQGKREEAEKIYLEMKDIMDGREPFKATFLNDLDILEKSGITHPDFEEIRKLLNQ